MGLRRASPGMVMDVEEGGSSDVDVAGKQA
jgi:hypothetical protein